jgi:DNA-binding transcriptional LysR family regulator
MRAVFRGAARLLGITPSGVSRGVSRFEEQLGVRLFNRHPRAIALTDEGQRFHDEVRPLVWPAAGSVDRQLS